MNLIGKFITYLIKYNMYKGQRDCVRKKIYREVKFFGIFPTLLKSLILKVSTTKICHK